jgi:hypothetical protein
MDNEKENHLSTFKDLASSPAMRASMDATLSLMRDLDSQTGQLKNMLSMQNQLADAMKPGMSISEKMKGLTSISDRLPKVDIPIMMDFPTSARQVHDMSDVFQQVQFVAIEEKAMRRKGVEAQIRSAKILADQREELEVMREAINALLKHNLEQSKQQSIALQERDRVEAERFRENTHLSKIAAWAGVISAILAAIAIWVQIYGK